MDIWRGKESKDEQGESGRNGTVPTKNEQP